LSKKGAVGKSKKRRRTADGFKSFLLHLRFLIKFMTNAVLPVKYNKIA
jgi:hypothetical protein